MSEVRPFAEKAVRRSDNYMQALQSSTALVGSEVSGQFAALQFVNRRLDLGIVDETAGTGVVGGTKAKREDTQPDREHGGGFLRVAEGAGLAHDVGNLLGALSLYSELLAAPGVLNDEYREYATDLRMLSERSHAMVSRLIDCARANGSDAEEPMTVLPAVVTRCRGLLTRVARRKVDLEFGLGAERPVNVPAEAVERILVNLIKNAAESMGSEGTIAVMVAAEEDHEGASSRVVMRVSDTGPGMTKERARLLGEATTPNQHGRGLGFRVVRELAALSDGCLTLESIPGEGTAVSVVWPTVEQFVMEGRDGEKKVMRGAAGWIAC